jgi:hypothetical protein
MTAFGTSRTWRDVRLESGMRSKAEVRANHSGFMGSRRSNTLMLSTRFAVFPTCSGYISLILVIFCVEVFQERLVSVGFLVM